jgi:hypothetical protein
MPKPKEIEVVRRAYKLWKNAGEPKDDEVYFQAKKELQEELEKCIPR